MNKRKKTKTVSDHTVRLSTSDISINYNNTAQPLSCYNPALYNTTKIVLLVIFFFMLGAFIFSLFKNIQYPLLWNDETETAMYAKRILQYGYPKIHDGKNIVWLSELPDKKIGIDKRSDSCSALVWGQYYFAAIGASFAEMTDDIYFKTALLRIPFTLVGFIGLFIMASSVISLFGKDVLRRLTFLIIFLFFSLSSISLTLHLREARHPALVVFLSACILYVYLNYRRYNKIKNVPYFVGLTLLLFLLYHVFHVVCFIFFAIIGLCECIALLKERDVKNFLVNMAPIFTAFILVIPFFFFCQSFAFGRAYSSQSYMTPWGKRALSIIHFFPKYEFLYPVLIAKAAFLCVWAYFSARRLSPGLGVRQKMQTSSFLSFFFIVYILITAFFPSSVIFERYYIILIPIMPMILSLDIFGTFELLSQIHHAYLRNLFKGVLVIMLLLASLVNGPDKIGQMREHLYELLHQYKGPLDFVIPFIKSHYKSTENLVIATNYEELAYMYYLGSAVIVGYVGNNIDEDAKSRPDVVVFRKKWTFIDPTVFNQFLSRYRYEKISFPILDYPVNNIPERNFGLIRHLYKTPLCNDEKRCLDVFIRLPENTS